MTPPLRSIVFVRVVHRLQDLYYRPAARRQALSRGRGLHATLSCALRVYTPGYTVLAASLGTRIPRTRGCWDARCDVDIFSSTYIWYLSFVLFYFLVLETISSTNLGTCTYPKRPRLLLHPSTKHGCTECVVPILFCLICMICYIRPHSMPAE